MNTRTNVQRLLHPIHPSDWCVSVTLAEFAADPEGLKELGEHFFTGNAADPQEIKARLAAETAVGTRRGTNKWSRK